MAPRQYSLALSPIWAELSLWKWFRSFLFRFASRTTVTTVTNKDCLLPPGFIENENHLTMPRIYASPHINRTANAANSAASAAASAANSSNVGNKFLSSISKSNRSSNDSIRSLNDGSIDVAQAVAAFEPIVDSCLSKIDSSKDVASIARDAKSTSSSYSRSRSTSPTRKAIQENNRNASNQNAQAKPVGM